MLNYRETERSFLSDNFQILEIARLSLCIEIQFLSISKSKDYYQCHRDHPVIRTELFRIYDLLRVNDVLDYLI